VSIFFDLFSPGQRHRVDEQERLEHTREVEGVNEPGRGPVDLNSGVVLIKAAQSAVKPKDDEAAGTVEDAADEPSDSEPRK
jgi:hypothetical protein